MVEKLSSIPLLGSLTAEQYQLANGLRIAIVVDRTTPIFSYQTWFKVGSADEPAGHQGLAHLFEHMMFRKTSSREMGVWEREVNANGGKGINAYTSRDQTVYFFSFPKEKLPLAAELESDRMRNLVIEEEMFETEKGAVLTERNRGLDEPRRYLWEEMYKLTYVQHPYRYSIIGEEESIKNFTVAEARLFYSSYYAPNNAMIIIVGDVSPDEVVSSIDSLYGSFSANDLPVRAHIAEPRQTEDRFSALSHRKATQAMIAKAWHIPNILSDDYPVLETIGRLLTSGKSSPLQERLISSAKATSVFADVFVGKDLGAFEFFAQLSDGVSFESVEAVVHTSINELARGSVPADRLQIVKNNLKKEFYRTITSPSTLARLLGDGFITTGNLAYLVDVIQKIDEVTLSDIQRVVRRYVVNGKSSTIHLLPERGEDR